MPATESEYGEDDYCPCSLTDQRDRATTGRTVDLIDRKSATGKKATDHAACDLDELR
jgi:hypothetical protein